MALTDEEQERITKIETTVKELRNLLEALTEDLRTAKLTVDQDVQIQGNLVVGGTITGNLAAGSVGNSQIVAQAITADKIKAGEIGNSHLADNAVTSAKIADGNVSTAELGDNAVTSAKIADGNVGTAELANNAVTTTKLANDAVTTAQIKPGAVGKDRLASDVQKSLVVYAKSTTAGGINLKPDAFNDWPLGVTLPIFNPAHPEADYSVIAANGDPGGTNDCTVQGARLLADGRTIRFYAVGGTSGTFRLNVLIVRSM